MKPASPTVPPEAIEAYNLYIHGEIDRRVLPGPRDESQRVSAVAASALVEQLMPNYAAAQQVSPTDSRLKTETRDDPLAAGQRQHQGLPGAPGRARPARSCRRILVVHENRGLNPHIEDIARRLALENFMALAPDGLTSVGGYPGDDEKGGELFGKVDRAKMTEDFVRRGDVAEEPPRQHRQDRRDRLLLRRRHRQHAGRADGAGPGRRGAVLRRRAAAGGRAEDQGRDPVHHGEQDTRLAAAWPAYDAALKAAGVPHEGYIYPGAVHGFNNDATPQRYNKAAADQAWKRTIAWFNKYAPRVIRGGTRVGFFAGLVSAAPIQ